MMPRFFYIILCFFVQIGFAFCEGSETSKNNRYTLNNELLDVVIVANAGDRESLDACIDGIWENCKQIRRVLVVSTESLTDRGEWVDEALFPFTRDDVAYYLTKEDPVLAEAFFKSSPNALEEYYQQLIKFYAAFSIPGISSNVLILDPGTVFLNPVQFLNSNYAGLFDPAKETSHTHFKHAAALVPNFKKYFFTYSGRSGHMVFQKAILDDLFTLVEDKHRMDFWKAFCLAVENDNLKIDGASEYEIYMNFAFSRTNQLRIRKLKSLRVVALSAMAPLKAYGHHYITCPQALRKLIQAEIEKSKKAQEDANAPFDTFIYIESKDLSEKTTDSLNTLDSSKTNTNVRSDLKGLIFKRIHAVNFGS